MNVLEDVIRQRLLRGVVRRLNNRRIVAVARRIAQIVPEPGGQPVAFFKASTGIDDLSWNSGFHLLASWGLRLQGVPVVYFACEAGMSRCVLGTNRDHVDRLPPCRSCIYQSRTLYAGVPQAARATPQPGIGGSHVRWFSFERDAELEAALTRLSLQDLAGFQWGPIPGSSSAAGLPLGQLCMPSLRWILRRHNLVDDEDTRFLLKEYILSAWSVAQEFSRFLDETKPRAVVLFNGQFFPEAAARSVAQQRGLRVITHEVGLQPASAFFTNGDATAYPIHIPEDFELDPAQNARLDAYLEQRFQGQFSMAGIRFWPNMRGLDQDFLAKAARFQQVVSIFTNVIFDTSQPHANTVFSDMFAWLDVLLQEIRSHPETLFVIRAHPDETRTRKQSRETVQAWVEERDVNAMENVIFVASDANLSSYELIQHSKFVLVYNSTIGLEASIMGKPVLCGGKARYTQYPTVFFPQTVDAQLRKLEELLGAQSIEVPPEFVRNARRFLYYQLFVTSLPFGEFLTTSVRPTQARLRSFREQTLTGSATTAAISAGILDDAGFVLDE